MPSPGRTREVAHVCLAVGMLGFGGPAAHVAMLRDEVVRRRAWMSDQDFVDHVGATALLPGPNSTELAIHLGRQRAGWRGYLLAGACFIGPAVVIVGALAWAYQRYGARPAVADLRWGLAPVVVALVAWASVALGRTVVVDPARAVAAGATAGLYLAGWHELALLAGAGAVVSVWSNRARLRSGAPGQPGFHAVDPSVLAVFAVFLKIGAVLYGSGYVLAAYLRHDVVGAGWLTPQQLLDAIAVGQLTPGPLFSTATFVGWQAAGVAGAAAATVGIFLPAFVFVAGLGRLVPWLRRSPWRGAFLDGVNAASCGLMAAVAVQLAPDAVHDVPAGALGAAALVALASGKVRSTWVVAAGLVAGVARMA